MHSERRWKRRGLARSGLVALIVGVCALAYSAAATPPAPSATSENPSGLPVPRYVTLKSNPVKARSGPSDDHRVLWDYQVRGLPVQVVGETKDWRRICDPDGSLSWVNKLTTDGRRAVMRTAPGQAPIYQSPHDNARVAAYLANRGLAALDRCQGDWCKIKVGGISGWVRGADVWGVADTPQCR